MTLAYRVDKILNDALIVTRAVEMCSFLPTATSVAAMLSATGPGAIVTGVLGIATAICQAVTAARSQPGLSLAAMKPGLGTVNGIPIEGDFLGGGK